MKGKHDMRALLLLSALLYIFTGSPLAFLAFAIAAMFSIDVFGWNRKK